MLKIKDSINLAELEKFGFECIEERWQIYEKSEENSNQASLLHTSFLVNTCGNANRAINYYIDGYTEEEVEVDTLCRIDTIFDLIQAGLVEKVNDDDLT